MRPQYTRSSARWVTHAFGSDTDLPRVRNLLKVGRTGWVLRTYRQGP